MSSYLFVVGVFCAIFFSGAQCLIPDFLKADVFSIYRHAAIETRNLQHTPVLPDDVTFYLYKSDNLYSYLRLDPSNLNPVKDTTGKVVFLVHGWINNKEVAWYEDMKNAFLTAHPDYSVIQVDWSKPAHQQYYVSSINTYDVAQIIGNVILDLNKNYGVSLDNVLVVGHSLGGQITGFIGKHVIKATGRKLPRIVALDPAGPLFDVRPDGKRLNKNDADVVQVLHSDGGTFGFKEACGTIDFFANGGSSQPGCKRIDLLDLTSLVDPIPCDHLRSCDLFVDAVLDPKGLLATRCTSWRQYERNECNDVKVNLGDLTSNETGTFYFETNKERPYSKKTRGSASPLDKVISLLHR